VPPSAIGHKALAVNLSDLAAMGAEPRAALLSLVLPGAMSVADFDEMMAGGSPWRDGTAWRWSAATSPGRPGRWCSTPRRSGGQAAPCADSKRGEAGDGVYVSGTVGAAAAGRLSRQREAAGAGPGRLDTTAWPHARRASSARPEGQARLLLAGTPWRRRASTSATASPTR